MATTNLDRWVDIRNKIQKVLANDDTMIINQQIQNMIIEDVSLYPATAKNVLQRVNILKAIPDDKYKLLYWALVSNKPAKISPLGQKLKD
jgi:hypothetical protein